MHRDSDVIQQQKEKLLEILSPLISNGEDYAFVDFPDHSNVGDSAIWLGELELFTKLTGNRPRYACVKQEFSSSELNARLPSGPIFLHGGGNFGDVWPDHHRFREIVLQQFPDRPVVQLPQSIHFQGQAGIDETARLISKHGNFSLIVRDTPSYDFARKYFDCPVFLGPDAAFAIGPLKRTQAVKYPAVALMRTDKEKSVSTSLSSAHVVDWLQEPENLRKDTRWEAALRTLKSNRWTRADMRERNFEVLASRRFERGADLLSKGARVVTDRLHGHVMCTLLDIPHVSLDNSNGKISSYRQTWMKDSKLSIYAQDPEDVGSLLDQLPSK